MSIFYPKLNAAIGLLASGRLFERN